MKIRSKILLAIWSVVLVLLLITSVIIKYWMSVQLKTRFTEDLKSSFSALRELNTLRNEEIVKSSEIIAETPRLKAVVELGDRNTALQLARELNQSIVSDFFALTDLRRRVLVQLLDGNVADVPLPDSSPSAARSSIDVRVIDRAIFRCARAPLVIGADVVGTLSLGFRIGHDDLEAIKTMTNSDVILLNGETIVVSTLPAHSEEELSVWMKKPKEFPDEGIASSQSTEEQAHVVSIQTPDDDYLATSISLAGEGKGSSPRVSMILLKPVEREIRAALKPVFNTFIILSVIVLVITALIGYLISQGITKPIAALVRSTTEIGKGNYDYAVSVGSDVELRYLAEKFQEMSQALKDKMSQLAERNTKLEDALQQLKEMQAELVKSERLAATGKLTAQLSHEINNPVHNVQSCLQTVLKRFGTVQASGRDKELLEVALEEVTRLAKLTHQMLDVYRTSMAPLEHEAVHLNDVVNEIVTTSAEALRQQSISVTLSLMNSLPAVEGSKDKLKQVFLNLILNAKDAMPHGGTLHVETSKRNGSILVDVSDTGIGIPPENINRIFDAFFTTKSKVSGVGLGLSVTYGIVRQHDGTISVKSGIGKGSTFSVVLPIKQS